MDEPPIGNPRNEAPENDRATANKGEKLRSPTTGSGASAKALTAEDEGVNGADEMPLPFLLGVLNDAKAPAAIKFRVASATLPYTHPRLSSRPAKPKVVADRFGFSIEPALARKLRK